MVVPLILVLQLSKAIEPLNFTFLRRLLVILHRPSPIQLYSLEVIRVTNRLLYNAIAQNADAFLGQAIFFGLGCIVFYVFFVVIFFPLVVKYRKFNPLQCLRRNIVNRFCQVVVIQIELYDTLLIKYPLVANELPKLLGPIAPPLPRPRIVTYGDLKKLLVVECFAEVGY